MIKINATVRNAVRAILADSASYDASTMVISRIGQVSALKDADKTFNGPETVRYLVGHVSNMVRQDGTTVEGF